MRRTSLRHRSVSSANERHGRAASDRPESDQAKLASHLMAKLFAERNGTRTLAISIGASRCGK
jgi:hypothetical protein